MPEEIIRNEITFEIQKVRLIERKISTTKEWFEIQVLVTDQHGSRHMIVQEGDVLKAIFEEGMGILT